MTPARSLPVQLARNQKADLLRRALDDLTGAAVRGKGGMHHFKVIRQVGGKQFLDQSALAGADLAARLFAHDISGFARRAGTVPEQHRNRHIQRCRNGAQIVDRRLGLVPLHLAEPADRAAQCLCQITQGDSTGLAQRPEVHPKGSGRGNV